MMFFLHFQKKANYADAISAGTLMTGMFRDKERANGAYMAVQREGCKRRLIVPGVRPKTTADAEHIEN
jgi:hypothetical protein